MAREALKNDVPAQPARGLTGLWRSVPSQPVPSRKRPPLPAALKMATSLGSNTYNRQNWEDAVRGAGKGHERGLQGRVFGGLGAAEGIQWEARGEGERRGLAGVQRADRLQPLFPPCTRTSRSCARRVWERTRTFEW